MASPITESAPSIKGTKKRGRPKKVEPVKLDASTATLNKLPGPTQDEILAQVKKLQSNQVVVDGANGTHVPVPIIRVDPHDPTLVSNSEGLWKPNEEGIPVPPEARKDVPWQEADKIKERNDELEAGLLFIYKTSIQFGGNIHITRKCQELLRK